MIYVYVYAAIAAVVAAYMSYAFAVSIRRGEKYTTPMATFSVIFFAVLWPFTVPYALVRVPIEIANRRAVAVITPFDTTQHLCYIDSTAARWARLKKGDIMAISDRHLNDDKDHYTLSCDTLDELFIAAKKRGEALEITSDGNTIELALDYEVLAEICTANDEGAANASERLIAQMHEYVRATQREDDEYIEPTLSASKRN